MNAGGQQQNLALTTGEEIEYHQQRDDISKFKKLKVLVIR